MRPALLTALILLTLTLTPTLTPLGVADAGPSKGKKPGLQVRAVPRIAFSPANILLIAELRGGDDLEEYYCPEIQWDWDDGGKSTHEADCAPYEEGMTIDRRFTAEHRFQRAGIYNVRVTLLRTDKVLKRARVRVTVRAGLGDPTGLRQ